MLQRVITAVLVATALTSCRAKNAAPPAADVAAPPTAAPADAAGGRETEAPVDAGADRAASGGFVPCRTTWLLPAGPELRLLGGALAGGIAGLLFERSGAPIFLLVGGEAARTTSVALPEDPEGERDAGACGPLQGGVVSYGDRYLVAYGRVESGTLSLRVRAVTPEARLLPVDRPGRPGAAGEPIFTAPASGDDIAIRLDAYPAGVILAVSGPGVSRSLTVSPTGAPLDTDKLGWSLVAAPSGSAAPWLLPPPLADSMAVRYVGPFGDAALTVEDDQALVMLVRRAAGPEPFRFEDGWVPAAGEPAWFAPGRVLRMLPGPGPVRGLAYDGKGRVDARLQLPAGVAPLAVSRNGRTVLFVEPTGAIGSCGVDAPVRLPLTVDAGAALASPGTGASTCGRER
ncbi:MAG: hypothetical protein HY905_12195 [Deltaproteobacteria bacterium]|nr:hypothetical protein [Deltaproteobacteria bacterium]